MVYGARVESDDGKAVSHYGEAHFDGLCCIILAYLVCVQVIGWEDIQPMKVARATHT